MRHGLGTSPAAAGAVLGASPLLMKTGQQEQSSNKGNSAKALYRRLAYDPSLDSEEWQVRMLRIFRHWRKGQKWTGRGPGTRGNNDDPNKKSMCCGWMPCSSVAAQRIRSSCVPLLEPRSLQFRRSAIRCRGLPGYIRGVRMEMASRARR